MYFIEVNIDFKLNLIVFLYKDVIEVCKLIYVTKNKVIP